MKPINPSFPITEIGSVAELMDIALGMEEEAARRYEQLAQAMRRAGNDEIAAVFGDLAAMEQEHADGISAWSRRESGRQPKARHFSWQLPETFGAEGEGPEARLLTPYRALGIAVRNEERAFSFYAYLAAMAEDRAVREHAEAMAREELEHVATLRTMRRRAYHAQEGPRRQRPRAATMPELRAMAAGLAASSARVYGLTAEVLEKAGEPAAAGILRHAAEQERHNAAASGGAPPAATSEALASAEAAGLLQPDRLTPQGALTLSLRHAETVFDSFMHVAERAPDEAVMREAQRLANGALERLALVRSLIGEAPED